MAYDFEAAQKRAHNQILRFGGGGFLVRNSVRRPCTMAIVDYKPREAELKNEGARRALVSAYLLDVPPNHELDMLLYSKTNELFRIVAPVAGIRPADIFVFFDCEVIYDSAIDESTPYE